jgi:glutamate dehydrogenase (NAD(P)+)
MVDRADPRDAGHVEVFPAYRVQHSSVLGPTKGGIRYDPHVTLGECAALAVWMTWKCALLRCRTAARRAASAATRASSRRRAAAAHASLHERAAAASSARRRTSRAGHGDERADDGLDDGHVLDAGRLRVPEIVTGKPVALGGSLFRHEATGAGVVMVTERACRRLGWNLAEQRASSRASATSAASRRRSSREGRDVVAVSDISGGVYSRAGLDLVALRRGSPITARSRRIRTCDTSATRNCSSYPCDILVLAALEDQITALNAPRLDTRLVVEGANGPTSIEADAILAERGIPVLPDVLTTPAGDRLYFEWVQDLGRLFWTRDEIRARLADKLGDAFDRVWQLSDERASRCGRRRSWRESTRSRGAEGARIYP